MADEKIQKKFPAFQLLMNKYGYNGIVDKINAAAISKEISDEFWKYPKKDEKATITFLKAPEGTISEAFKKSGSVGYVGTITDTDGVKWPIGLTETQLIDVAAEMQVHFGWSPDIDPGLKVVETLSFEVETRGWEADIKDKDGNPAKESRKKSTFMVIKDEAYSKKSVQFAKQIEEFNANSGTGVDITADMFGLAPEKPAPVVETTPAVQ